MKRLFISLALLGSPLLAMASVAINVGEPGYYGQIQVGGMPPPQVLYPDPVIIQPAPGVVYSPLYLRVPVRHYRHWRRYCGWYNACGRPVYFVNDYWYQNTYVPRYRYDRPVRYGHRYEHGNRWHRDHWNEHR